MSQFEKLQGSFNDAVKEAYDERIILAVQGMKKMVREIEGLNATQQGLLDEWLQLQGNTLQVENDAFESFTKALGPEKLKAVQEAIKTVTAVNKDYLKVMEAVQRLSNSYIGDPITVEVENADASAKKLTESISDLREQFDLISESVGITTELLQNFILLVGNEAADSIQTVVNVVGILGSTTQRVIDDLRILREETEKNKVAASDFVNFAKSVATFDIVGAIFGGIVGIANAVRALRREEQRTLEEEFLGDDVTRQIASDFGQARVINNRISLTPNFNFLDPSQLTQARQRDLAETIYDEIIDIAKSKGGGLVT
jgi:hypothetical protein